MSRSRRAIVIVSKSQIEDYLAGSESDASLRYLLKLPPDFKILHKIDDFDTGGLKIKVESERLPETPDGETLPYMEVVYDRGYPTKLILFRRTVLTEPIIEINLSTD